MVINPINKHRVFVYGTLMRNGSLHHLIEKGGGDFIGFATTVDPKWFMYSLGAFPAVIDMPIQIIDKGDGCNIMGEIWLVSDDVLRNMDRAESEGSMYIRGAYDFSYHTTYDDKPTFTNRATQAWMYVFNTRAFEEGSDLDDADLAVLEDMLKEYIEIDTSVSYEEYKEEVTYQNADVVKMMNTHFDMAPMLRYVNAIEKEVF